MGATDPIPYAAKCFTCAYKRLRKEEWGPVPYCAYNFVTLRFADDYQEAITHQDCSHYLSEYESKTWRARN